MLPEKKKNLSLNTQFY